MASGVPPPHPKRQDGERGPSGGKRRAGHKAPVWVSSPILGLRYRQTTVGSTPFASAKVPLAGSECTKTPFYIKSQAPDASAATFRYRMNYPATLTTHQSFREEGYGIPRNPADVRESRKHPPREAAAPPWGQDPAAARLPHTAAADAGAAAKAKVPNAYWAHPPRTEASVTELRHKDRLPPDGVHPMLTKAHAAARRKLDEDHPRR
ncbi:hypothetical protein DIPPA_17603, partial [Diplonema papillatum]